MSVKPESNDKVVLRIMTENAGKSRDEVVAILMDLVPSPPRVASGKITKERWLIGYYNWGIGKGAPGEKIASARGVGKTPGAARSATAEPKAPKEKKSGVTAVPKPKMPADKPKVTDKTVEEIADIKAKNMARLKSVAQKVYANQADGKKGKFTKAEAKAAKDYVAAVTADIDMFKAPESLTMAEVEALV